MNVCLKPHIGYKNTPIGKIEVEHDQWLVYVNDKHIGYIGKQENAPLNLINSFPESFVRELKKEVSILVGGNFPVAMPPSDEEVREHLRIVNNQEDEGDDE